MRKIGWALALALGLVACAQPRFAPGTSADAAAELAAGPPLPLDRVWLIERGGASPGDTTVTFARQAGRTVVLRHPAPDNATFAMVIFPADTAASGDVEIMLAPAPGRYGLTIAASPELPKGATIRFSYAAHFQAPQGSLDRYVTLTRLEQGLGVGRVVDSTQVRFVPASRPAADMLAFAVGEPGTYHLAAPK